MITTANVDEVFIDLCRQIIRKDNTTTPSLEEVYVRYYEGMSIYRDDLGYEATRFGKATRERPLLERASFEASLSRVKVGDLEFYFRTGFLHL
jgi:hypothetical protein